MSSCECKERPMCQMIACHLPADWSLCMPALPMRLGGVMFICDWHWQKMQEPIPGIDRPSHASEDWRPSIVESVRLAIIRKNHEDRKAKLARQRPVSGYFQRNYTPNQMKAIEVLRERGSH